MESPRKEQAGDGEQAAKSFVALLPSAFTYPFVGRGKYIILGGAVGFTAVGFLGDAAAIVGMLLGALLAGYVAMYLIDVIATCAGGADEPPDWPDLRSVDDTVRPLLLVIGTLGISLGPALVYRFGPIVLFSLMGWEAWKPSDAVFRTLLIAGSLYAPMGLLAVALRGSLVALNPWTVLVAILRVAPFYALALAVMAAAGAVGVLTLSYLGVVPLVGQAALLYLVMVEGRVLGLIYRTQSGRLKWFD